MVNGTSDNPPAGLNFTLKSLTLAAPGGQAHFYINAATTATSPVVTGTNLLLGRVNLTVAGVGSGGGNDHCGSFEIDAGATPATGDAIVLTYAHPFAAATSTVVSLQAGNLAGAQILVGNLGTGGDPLGIIM